MSNINLDISDFGPINQAKIELKKLNVIAGVNGSGKTTSSKLLYCFLTSNSDEKEYLTNMSINRRIRSTISSLLDEFKLESGMELENYFELHRLDNELLLKSIDATPNAQFNERINSLKKIVNESQIKNKEAYLEKINTIECALEINSIEHRQFFEVSNSLLNSEFRIKDLKLENPDVQFYGKQDDCEFLCKLDYNESKLGAIIDRGDLNSINIKNIIYIDSPSIFNSKSINESIILKNQPFHLRFLSRILKTPIDNDDVYDEVFNQKLDHFKDKITELIGGFIFYDEAKEEFFFKKGENIYSMENTASGIKQLGIIQMLLSNRTLTENSFLIMDEPEVNLHPEWQIKLAQILVLIAKELNVTSYINTHSPFLAEAIEVHAKYYKIYDETNFYLTEKVKDEEKYDYILMQSNDISEVYENLGNPFDTLNNIRFETELRDDLGE